MSQTLLPGRPATIWRIERACGSGPYNWGLSPKSSVADEMSSGWVNVRHPPAWHDTALMASVGLTTMYREDIKPWHFGFGSPDQFRSWVYEPHWRETMHREGFRISVYEARNAHIGDTQAMFERRAEELSHRLFLTEI